MKFSLTFPEFIMHCCRMSEWSLRDYLKELLVDHGYSFIEDDYVSRRALNRKDYDSVHNLLFYRGSPKVCLVAHTDVCRDHNGSGSIEEVDPVIKSIDRLGGTRDIIQDRDCKIQVGGDDRLGVAINTWIAIHIKTDLGLLFTTDEEIGLISADYCSFSKLNDFELLAQVDRGNQSYQLVSNISGIQLCSNEVVADLLKIAEDMKLPRREVRGLITDVAAIKENGRCKNAVNMTCGYHNSWGASNTEFIDIKEADETRQYVENIIKFYEDKININLNTVSNEIETSASMH